MTSTTIAPGPLSASRTEGTERRVDPDALAAVPIDDGAAVLRLAREDHRPEGAGDLARDGAGELPDPDAAHLDRRARPGR